MNYPEHNLPDLHMEDDPELREIEDLLRQLPVREPSTMLDRRIEALSQRSGWIDALKYTGLGAAAMLALTIGAWPLVHGRPSHLVIAETKPDRTDTLPSPNRGAIPTKSARSQNPLLLERTDWRVTDDGVIAVLDGAPVQRYRKQSVQQVWMVDPRTGSPMSVTIPREQVTLRKIEAY